VGSPSPTETKLPKGVDVVGSIVDAVRDADAAVIVTEWDELKGWRRKRFALDGQSLIVDGRNLLDSEETRRAGFAYEGIGRPTRTGATCCPATCCPKPQNPAHTRGLTDGSDHPRRRKAERS